MTDLSSIQPRLDEFRAGLDPDDQAVFDDLVRTAAGYHLAIKYSDHDLPFHVYLLSLLIEEHKELRRLREQIGL